MQKYKYALDLEDNIYSLSSDFDNYKLDSDEINKIYFNPILDDNSKYIGKEIIYDHTYIYITPKEFIKQYKLSNDQKTELYKNIGKIKIKDIISEDIKDISFIFHHMLTIRAQEEADVQGYEMPISSYWQCIPSNQRMNFGIENVLNRQNNAINTKKNLDNCISINMQENLTLSDEATHILNQEKDNTLSAFYDGLTDYGFGNANQNKNKNTTQQKNEALEEVLQWSICHDSPEDFFIPPKLRNEVNQNFLKDSGMAKMGCPDWLQLLIFPFSIPYNLTTEGIKEGNKFFAENTKKNMEKVIKENINEKIHSKLYNLDELKNFLRTALTIYPDVTEPACGFASRALQEKLLQLLKKTDSFEPVYYTFPSRIPGLAPTNAIVLVPKRNGEHLLKIKDGKIDFNDKETYKRLTPDEFNNIIVLSPGAIMAFGQLIHKLEEYISHPDSNKK